MNNSNENINEEKKNEININSIKDEQKKDEKYNTLSVINNGTLLNLLTNDKIYLNIENFKELLKSYHKSFMQNIGLMVKFILKNSDIDKNEFITIKNKMIDIYNDEFDDYSEYEQYISILHKMELSHNDFISNIKKIILKTKHYYKKRKNRLKIYQEKELNSYLINMDSINNLNNHNYFLNSQNKGNNININSNKVIINNIKNIINTV